jgi:hypothetical protein
MGQPTWRKIGTLAVPMQKGCAWTPALDYLTPGRLYKVDVPSALRRTEQASGTNQTATDEQTWTPESASPCTADGDMMGLTRKNGAPPLPDVRVGALIARVGGSTADQAGEKERTVLFAVGRHCVFQAPEPPKVGTLYLGINDTPGSASRLEGRLEVEIWEAL